MTDETEAVSEETERAEPAPSLDESIYDPVGSRRPAPLTADEKMVLLASGMSKKNKVAALCRETGISRKQYYKLLKRAKRALREAVEDRKRGRKPKTPDPEKEALRKQVKSLRQKLVRTETLLAVAQRIARAHPVGLRLPGEKKAMGARGMTGRRKR